MKMDYIPGQIQENLQKEHFFLINYDFTWLNCGPRRYSEISDSSHWDETESLELLNGDVIVVRFFNPNTTAYSYLERVIHENGDITEYKTESIVSLGLLEKNLDPQKFENKTWTFTDVTKSFERDEKIESILNDTQISLV